MDKEELQCFCGDQNAEDACMVNCNALHILHFDCIKNYIKAGKRQCPFDRKPINKCLHNGKIKKLPQVPRRNQDSEEPGDYPCYICHSSTRPGLEFDQVVMCSRCQQVFCHPSCVQQITHQQFDMSHYWYCPECERVREQNRQRRRNR